MWSDNETGRDFLNFSTVARTAAELVRQAGGQPLSMGISGGWGVGKSSMVKLIEDSLKGEGADKFVFITFNAWLYQGYDDAKAALLDVIAGKLLEHATTHKKSTARIQEFFASVNWLRAAGIGARVALAIKTLGVSEAAIASGKALVPHGLDEKEKIELKKDGKEIKDEWTEVWKHAKDNSPPKQIHELRDHFAKLLTEMGVTLVVFVDDLDRCLPETAISTLEAIRLFLFMDHTAFVIAADEKMIRHAVRIHFGGAGVDEDQVTSYFDKLIQVPLRVPPLGTQEVRAYLFLLFIENSNLTKEQKEAARNSICIRLGESWQGKRVDRDFVVGLIANCPDQLKSQFDLADRIAPLMTSARQIQGNPRLIKRFLNTLYLRLATAKAQSVTVDEAVLAKLLLFERCAEVSAHSKLLRDVNDHAEGKPTFLKPWEEAAAAGDSSSDLPQEWTGAFEKDWLALSPALNDIDLRPAVYVSREHMPIITKADRLTSDGAKALEALMMLKGAAPAPLIEKLKPLGKRELGMILDHVLTRAKQVQTWAPNPSLYALLAVVAAEASLGENVGRFLIEIPPAQLRPALIPLLKDKTWAVTALKHWYGQAGTSSPVKNAIKTELPGTQ
jgi:predicted KAP-like P-loop ATPase